MIVRSDLASRVTVRSDTFVDQTSRFAVGRVADCDSTAPGLSAEFAGAAQLRTQVYLNLGYVNVASLGDDGTELDRDDARSAHFVVLERGDCPGEVSVVGTMRLVIKHDETPLPLERMCPDAFSSGPAPLLSTEVSRWICQHEDRSLQILLKWPLFVAGLDYVDRHHLDPVYGLLKEELANSLTAQGIPARPLAPVRYLNEINTSKQPCVIDLTTLHHSARAAGVDGLFGRNGFSYFDIGHQGIEVQE